jgi:hypothetical protein
VKEVGENEIWNETKTEEGLLEGDFFSPSPLQKRKEVRR